MSDISRLDNEALAWSWREVVVPRPGCGVSRLDWQTVRPMLRLIWDDQVLVISPL
jgi:hypothetical protein